MVRNVFGLRTYSKLAQIWMSVNRKSKSSKYLMLVAGIGVAGFGGVYIGRKTILANPPADLFPLTSTTALGKISPPQYASAREIKKAIEELRTLAPQIDISCTEVDISSHSNSVFSTHASKDGDVPLYVIYPTSTEEVAQVLKLCHTHAIPVVPFGAGTSLEGHFYSTRRGVVVDTSRMDKVLAINHQDQDAVVQCGVNWMNLNEQLDGYGLLMGCDCGPSAKIGGMVATNASGINATNYGAMINNVISVKAVLADGTIVKTKQRPRKSSAGYNLTSLFIGSEGTLGIVTEVTVKLHVIPRHETVVVTQFESIKDATNTVTQLFQSGVKPGAIELLDGNSMHCLNYSGYFSKPWAEVPTLFFKLGGLNEKVVAEYSKELSEIAYNNKAKAIMVAKDEAEGNELFSARKNIFFSILDYGKNEIHEDVRLWVTDIAVPISKLSPVLDKVHQMIIESGLQYIIVGHVGDGNFHADIFYKPEDFEKCEQVVNKMMELGLSNEGTSSGEHGIGNGKRGFLQMELGENAIDLMRKIKFALDPKKILNPDKVFKIDPRDPYD